MASSKEYLDFILEQLPELDDVSYRAMTGEWRDNNGGEKVKRCIVATDIVA